MFQKAFRVSTTLRKFCQDPSRNADWLQCILLENSRLLTGVDCKAKTVVADPDLLVPLWRYLILAPEKYNRTARMKQYDRSACAAVNSAQECDWPLPVDRLRAISEDLLLS